MAGDVFSLLLLFLLLQASGRCAERAPCPAPCVCGFCLLSRHLRAHAAETLRFGGERQRITRLEGPDVVS